MGFATYTAKDVVLNGLEAKSINIALPLAIVTGSVDDSASRTW